MELPAHFEALMNRSPISQAEITTFLRDMRRTPSGTLVTSKLLAERIQSNSEAQAIQAIEVLEAALESETEGSIEFRTEIGRYRFLNEIIRILSPKYLGESTPAAVKERAVKFLEDAAGSKRKRWFPSEHSKIQAVYQSLVEGSVIKKSTKFPSTEADEEAELQKSIFDRAENAAVLKKLLSSKDPIDLRAANSLIKNLVEEESRRIERRAELHSLIDRIETSTSLLVEMLSQPKIDKEIVNELADSCKTLRQRLGGIATETNDETTSLLQASENLEQALALYDKRKNFKDEEIPDMELNSATAGNFNKNQKVLSLADELLIGLDIDINTEPRIQQQNNPSMTLTQFMERSGGGGDVDNLLNLDIDIPSKIPQREALSPDDSKEKEIKLGMEEIGRLSRELMENSLKGKSASICAPEFKKTDKTPLSQIRLSSLENLTTVASSSPILYPQPMTILDLDFLDKSKSSSASTTSTKSVFPNSDENVLLVIDTNDKTNTKPTEKLVPNTSISNHGPENSEILKCKAQMNSIKDFDLDAFELIDNLEPLKLNLEDGCKDVSLTLTFGTSSTLPKLLKVAVITLTNKSSTYSLTNYVFQLLPPKGIQVKLLPPESMELNHWKKSFLPPPLLTQVALILIPEGIQTNSVSNPKLSIRYILSYTFGDETALHNGNFEIPSGLHI